MNQDENSMMFLNPTYTPATTVVKTGEAHFSPTPFADQSNIFAHVARKQLSTIAMRSLNTILNSISDELMQSLLTHDSVLMSEHIKVAIDQLVTLRKAINEQ